jgi:hypothetical protein
MFLNFWFLSVRLKFNLNCYLNIMIRSRKFCSIKAFGTTHLFFILSYALVTVGWFIWLANGWITTSQSGGGAISPLQYKKCFLLWGVFIKYVLWWNHDAAALQLALLAWVLYTCVYWQAGSPIHLELQNRSCKVNTPNPETFQMVPIETAVVCEVPTLTSRCNREESLWSSTIEWLSGVYVPNIGIMVW